MPTQPAVLGTARLANFRLGYESASLAAVRATAVRVTIGGVDVGGSSGAQRVKQGSMTIRDVVNDAPNTAAFVVVGTAPTDGQDVRVSLNADAPRLLFNGTIQADDMTYVGAPLAFIWPVSAVDDLFRLNEKRPFGTWVDTSVTTIAQAIIAAFAPGFTSTHVAVGLPTVSIIFDGLEEFSACLARLATAIGGYFYVEDLDLHLFQTEVTDPPLDLDSTPDRFENDPPITVRVDRSQLRNRVYGKGHGENVSMDVLAGETIIPLDDVVMFNPLGGRAVGGTTPDGAQSQRLIYTGVQLSSGGALVGPGVTPSVAMVGTSAPGAGLGAGLYTYAYTWVTAAGDTLPSPLGTVTTGDTTDPAGVTMSATDDLSNGYVTGYAIGDVLRFAISFSYDFYNTVGVTDVIVAAGTHTVVASTPWPTYPAPVYLTMHWTVPAPINVYLHRYVSVNGGPYRYNGYGYGAAAGAFGPSIVDYQPYWNTAPAINRSIRQVALSAIALGPSGTTARKVYRTGVGGSQLKLQQTIANNSASVGVTDATADGSLGANVPTSDTSGLTATAGQVNSGSTSLPTSGSGPFSTAGGWIQTYAGDLVRYTGISGNSLTGIPTSGPGAILTSIIYSSPISPVSALTGVTGLTLPMLRGTPVHIWVQRDDLAAQANQIALDLAQGRVSDGVIEGPPIVDERRGEDSLIALCDATLALFARPLVTITYATRDPKTKSGKPITVNLAAPPISETLTIQDVTITELGNRRGPLFAVVASNHYFTLEAMLRKLAT